MKELKEELGKDTKDSWDLYTKQTNEQKNKQTNKTSILSQLQKSRPHSSQQSSQPNGLIYAVVAVLVLIYKNDTPLQ